MVCKNTHFSLPASSVTHAGPCAAQVLGEHDASVKGMLEHFGLRLKPAAFKQDVRPLLKEACAAIFGSATGLVDMMVAHFPSSKAGSALKARNLPLSLPATLPVHRPPATAFSHLRPVSSSAAVYRPLGAEPCQVLVVPQSGFTCTMEEAATLPAAIRADRHHATLSKRHSAHENCFSLPQRRSPLFCCMFPHS